MNVLITGCSGFLGKSLIAKSPSNWNILGIYNNNNHITRYVSENNLNNVNLHKCDLSSLDSFKEIFELHGKSFDVCFHFAGSTPFSKTGFNGDANLRVIDNFEYAFSLGLVDKIIFPSSYIVYGEQDRYPVSEKATPNPGSAYGKNKFECETLLLKYLKKYDTSYLILRSSCVVSPNQTHGLINLLVGKAMKDEEITIYNKFERRDNLDLEDLLRVFIDHSVSLDGIYNVGSGKSLTVEDIARIVVDIAGKGHVKVLQESVSLMDNFLDISKLVKQINFNHRKDIRESILSVFDKYE